MNTLLKFYLLTIGIALNLLLMSCTYTSEDCSPLPLTILDATEMIVTSSDNLDETIVIDTFYTAPLFIKVLLAVDETGICNPTLENPIDKNTINVTFDKDILINFNTVTPAYSNLYLIDSIPIADPFYDKRDYSKVFIPLNQAILANANFDAETIRVAYEFTTSDGLVLADSTSIILDY